MKVTKEFSKAEGAIRVRIEHDDGTFSDHKIHAFNRDRCPHCGEPPAGGTPTGLKIQEQLDKLTADAQAYHDAWVKFLEEHGA